MAPTSTREPIEIQDDDVMTSADNQTINEEFKLWKKNTPFLYETVLERGLDWPSLTCQWMPDSESPSDLDFTTQRLLLGTHTSNGAQESLMIAEVRLPRPGAVARGKEAGEMYDEDRAELGSHSASNPLRFKIIQRINHSGEVNRARYMPQKPDILATKTVSGEVHIFDRTKHESFESGSESRPEIRLKGQTKEGYGLAWSKLKEGHIVSAGQDTTVALWNITAYNKADKTLQPLREFKGHSSNVGDVDWHGENDWMIGSAGDDRKIMIWDTRSDNNSKPSMSVEGHRSDINSLAFAPSSPNLLLSGSSDNTVALWDLRKLSVKLHSFESHTDDVLQVEWSPHSPTHFASASSDRRVHIWDLSAIGAEQTPDDAEDGPPELLFVHGGHTAALTDISWNPNPQSKFTLASTATNNNVMVWEMSRSIYNNAEAEVDPMELE